MGLSQDQWYAKLRTFLPSWYFEEENLNFADMMALAKALAAAQEDADFIFDQTFIEEAEAPYLDLHGEERQVPRLPGEADHPSYSGRIRHIRSTTGEDNIFNQIKSVLNNGEPILLENMEYGFAGDDIFAGEEDAFYISKRKTYNRFTVIVPGQEVLDDSEILEHIVEAVDRNKALGVAYDVYYRGKLVEIELEDESGILLLESGDILYFD